MEELIKRLDELEKREDNTFWIFLFFVISTLVILYFTYKWTYLIQPETSEKASNEISSAISDFFGK